MPGLVGTVAGDPVAQSVGRRSRVTVRSQSYGPDRWPPGDGSFFPHLPSPPSLARWQGSSPEDSPFFCWGIFHPEERDSGKWYGLLTSWGPSPRGRARTSRNWSLFSFPLFFSQLLRKTCPKNHSQQPCLTPVSDVWATILLMYVRVFLKLCNLSSVYGQEP